jgi:hypothetical protein
MRPAESSWHALRAANTPTSDDRMIDVATMGHDSSMKCSRLNGRCSFAVRF